MGAVRSYLRPAAVANMSLRLVLLLGALALVNSTPPVHAAQPMKKITVAGVKASFDVEFDVQLSAAKSGSFTLEVHPEWAPLGAARFKSLVKSGFFTDCRFFRVIKGFMAQFGINGDPKIAAKWHDANLKDDKVTQHNDEGFISFATAGPNTRTTQMFINLVANRNLDDQGFSPFGKVVKGMDVVKELYSGYGEGAPDGNGPDQTAVEEKGNAYLKKDFPLLSFTKSA